MHSPNGATATTRKRTAETEKDMPDILFFSFPLFFWPHTYEEGEKVIVPSFFLPFRARAKSNEQSFFSQGEKGIFHAAGRGSPSPCVRELAYVLQYSVYVRGGAGAFTFFFLVFLSPLHDASMSPNNKGGRGGERGESLEEDEASSVDRYGVGWRRIHSAGPRGLKIARKACLK